jgi:ubiquinone/menaquinone biosynthesis C-methylase UbiE
MTNSRPPSPQKITAPLVSVFSSAALLAALQLELFNALGEKAMTVEELAAAMQVKPRRLVPVLNVLVSLGLLDRERERYSNGEEAAYYLIKGKPSYIGGNHELYADLHRAAFCTAQSIREDRPVAQHDFRAMDDAALEAFFRGLHAFGVVHGRELASKYEFSRFRSLADVGGGTGNIAIGACEACPNLRATVLELERIVPIARRFIAEAGLSQRIEVVHAEITQSAPNAEFDVTVLRNLIQVLSPEDAQSTIANVGRSIRSGGEIYIMGYVLDDACREPWQALAYDVVFANIYESGRSYTDGEHRRWLDAGGFREITRELMPNNMSLIRAVKR